MAGGRAYVPGVIDEQLLRTAHSSLCISWGTDAPFEIGRVRAEKVGFAQIPRAVLDVVCRPEDVSALVPIVRQRVFAELAERGWDNEEIEFRPTVQRGRRRKFRDANERSGSFGRDKFGVQQTFGFDMRPELARATFQGFGSFRQLPDRSAV